MTTPTNEVEFPATLPTTQGLRWFGQAIRGSWGEIDGRGIRNSMEAYAAYMDENPPVMPAESVLKTAHDTFGVCLFPSDEGRPEWKAYWWDFDTSGHGCVICGDWQ